VAVTGRSEGSFHRVTFATLYRNFKTENYMVRIPEHGTTKLWTEQDKYMLERDVGILRYFHLYIKTPITEIFD
ncbi:hypothetical protein EJ02DRAFT_350144, partial [Clathrospora elynae]